MQAIELEKEIEYVSGQIVQKYNPQKVILFGSAVHGTFTRDSDLDFFIIKDDPRPGNERVHEVSQMFVHNVATDIIVYTPQEVARCLKWRDPFVKQILEKGRVIYG
jgi:predicted nucleotidyltransferase